MYSTMVVCSAMNYASFPHGMNLSQLDDAEFLEEHSKASTILSRLVRLSRGGGGGSGKALVVGSVSLWRRLLASRR